MPFNFIYTFDTQGGADAQEWVFSDPVGTGLQPANTARRWCHDTDVTASGSNAVGPPVGGQGGVGSTTGVGGDGYIYTEATSPAAAGDVFTVELNQDLDANANSVSINFWTNQNGAANEATCQVQTNEAGAGWVNRGPLFGGPGQQSTNWIERDVDLAGLVSSAQTRIRLVVTLGTTGDIWNNDFALDTITVVGVANSVGDSPVITIQGDNPLTLEVGANYIDPGATAIDTEDGDLTGAIVVGGDAVDTAVIGSYDVTYTVIDTDLNQTVETRSVNVVAPNPYQFIDDEFVNFPVGASTWSLAGGIITQSGSGTLEGLDAIAGVTACQVAGRTVYDVATGSLQMNVTGELFIDPEVEELLMGYDGNTELFRVTGNGHLIVGRSIDFEGFRRHSTGTAIRFEDTGTVNSFTDRVEFVDNARFDWFGGVIFMESGKFSFLGDSVTVRIYSLEAKLIYNTAEEQHQIRQETDDFISEAFDFVNGDFTIVGTQQQLNGYRTTHCGGALAFSGATPNEDVIVRNYAGGGRGNVIDVKHWQGSRPYLINSVTGSQLNTGAHIIGSNNSFGCLRVDEEIRVSLIDQSNTPVPDAVVFIRDTDNGDRRVYDDEGNNFDELADRVYTELTDQFGQTPVIAVRLANAFADQQNGSSNDAVNTGRYAWDYRGKNNNSSDLFDIHIWSYLHQYQPFLDEPLKGANVKELTQKLAPDFLVTETSQVTVTGYANADTSAKAYDLMKLWKITNLEIPSTDTLPGVREGDIFDSGEYDLVIDATASDPFDFDGSTVTLRATVYTGSVRSTGTVTLSNGATVTGFIQDVNGLQLNLEILGAVLGSRIYIEALAGGPATQGDELYNESVVTDPVLVPYLFTARQPIKVVIRKSSSAPYYKQFQTTGTITQTGYALSVSQLPD